MRIALVTNMFLPLAGGGEFVVHHLANQWCRQGHEVCVFNALTADVCHPEAGYMVKRYRIMRGATRFGYHRFPWRMVSSRSLARVLNEFNPDLISGHFANPVAFYLSDLLPKRAWCITSHGADIIKNNIKSQRDRYQFDETLAHALNAANHVIAISGSARTNLLDLGVEASLIRTIPNGVDLGVFRNPASIDVKELLGISRDSRIILTVGRNSPEKNLELGLRIFDVVAKASKDHHYLMVGKGSSELQNPIAELGLKHRITTCENLTGAPLTAAYQQSEVFLSTSHYECCPLVILESMASGLPIVATDVPGNCDLITTRRNGILFEAGNCHEAASAILELADDQVLRNRMLEENRLKIGDYGWDSISRNYLDLFS